MFTSHSAFSKLKSALSQASDNMFHECVIDLLQLEIEFPG